MAQTRGAAAERRPLATGLHWHHDPIELALEESARKRDQSRAEGLSMPAEMGRRLLLAQMELNTWVLRRVEKVRFENDRNVSRATSIELLVPEYAPVVLRGSDPEDAVWVVPLAVMRRRTLVNLDLRDEQGCPLTLLGLRYTQQLEVAMLRATALCTEAGRRSDELPPYLERIIRDAVTGTWHKVKETKEEVEGHIAVPANPKEERDLDRAESILRDPTFAIALERIWHNFTLFVTLPLRSGRHRLLRMKFEEPTDWRYQKPSITSDDVAMEYQPFAKLDWGERQWRARLGWTATRIRFLTPSAEHCASYHFEFSAPAGVNVARAVLLAGRPTEKPKPSRGRIVTADEVGGQGPFAGLHGVEVPTGSLSRAQIDLTIAARGWLTTMFVACLVVTATLGAVLFHHWQNQGIDPNMWPRIQEIVGLLVAVTAGTATYVAYHHPDEVAYRMLTWLRAVGTVAMAIPAAVACWLVTFHRENGHTGLGEHQAWLWLALLVAAACAGVVLRALWCSLSNSRKVSPWEMTGLEEEGMAAPRRPSEDFEDLRSELGFDTPAVGVYSAEGWWQRFPRDESWHTTMVEALRAATLPHHKGCETPHRVIRDPG